MLDRVGTAALVLGAVPLLPAMDRAQRDRHLFGQSAAGFRAVVEPLLLLSVGSCVRMDLHACSFFVFGYQEDYRMHLALCNPCNSTVHNDIELDTYQRIKDARGTSK